MLVIKGCGSQSVKFLAGTEDFDLKLKEVIEPEQKTKTINKKGQVLKFDNGPTVYEMTPRTWQCKDWGFWHFNIITDVLQVFRD